MRTALAARAGMALGLVVPGLAMAETDEVEPLTITGSVDGVYAYDSNRPADHDNFFAGVGTSAKRDNEFSINLAQVDFVRAPDPVGFKLSLGYGTAVDVVHAAEEDLWQNVVQASVLYQTRVGRGLLLEAGVYPSHIGFEGLASKDNWNYTHSWLGELSPYYQTGVKLAYPLGERWSGQLHVLNGWQLIRDNNRGKSLGFQIARNSDRLSLSFNGIVGPELAGNDDDLRMLLDTVLVYKLTPSFSFGVSGDMAREQREVGSDAHWHGIGLYARFAPAESRSAFALRTEYYDDEDGAISGTAQTLKEVTATFEHRPVERLIVKLEGRHDRSSSEPFADDQLDPAGAPLGERDQLLLLVGVVATF